MNADNCVICRKHALFELQEFAALPRVTSDTKPWASGGRLQACLECGAVQKPVDKTWLSEIDQIYTAYEIYKLSDGGEQVIFDESGAPKQRSKALVDVMLDHMPPAVRGKLIDLGCGNGEAIRSFSQKLPGWHFDATEFSNRNINRLKSIPGFRELYTRKVDGRYDAVTMIHSLEHMVSPLEALTDAVNILDPKGRLLIEVPNIDASLFDILVADHRTHFSKRSLAHLASQCDLEPLLLSDAILPKELTLIGRHGASLPMPKVQASVVIRHLQTIVGWLHNIIASAKRSAQTSSSFGIFGTSISGMWLFGAMSDQVHFFVDEDESRVGQKINGRPVLSPNQLSFNSCIYVPLIPPMAQRVIDRLAKGNGRYITPPPIFAAA